MIGYRFLVVPTPQDQFYAGVSGSTFLSLKSQEGLRGASGGFNGASLVVPESMVCQS